MLKSSNITIFITLPSFNTARRTLRGFEAMNMFRKDQVVGAG